MYDFTTETILNDLSKVSVLLPAADPSIPAGDKALEIKRLNTYLASNAGKVYRALGNNPVNEVYTITLPPAQTAGTYRLELDLQTSGSYPITFDRWAINKGKPIYVEFNVPTDVTTADDLATLALPLIQRGLIKNNGQAIKDIVVTKGTGTIILTAATDYIRFKGGFIGKLTADGEDFINIGTSAVVTTPGKEGFGTAWSIRKNLRIPTTEAIRWFGEDQDETPVVGTLYNQYTFRYTAERNFTTQVAVGGKVASVTTHVLLVPQGLATAFEALVTGAFGAGSILDNVTKAAVN